MGDCIAALAARIADLVGLSGSLHPFFVARATGLSLMAAEGMAVPAMLVGSALYFDDESPGWRGEVASLVAGHALRQQGLEDTSLARRELERELGMVDDPRETAATWEEPRRDSAILH
jgi:hypothetical protein